MLGPSDALKSFLLEDYIVLTTSFLEESVPRSIEGGKGFDCSTWSCTTYTDAQKIATRLAPGAVESCTVILF